MRQTVNRWKAGGFRTWFSENHTFNRKKARRLRQLALLTLGIRGALLLCPSALPAGELIYVKKETREATKQASLEAMLKGFVTIKQSDWKFIGPFDNSDGRGMDAAYPPEDGIDFDAKYHGLDDQRVKWQDGSRFKDGVVNNLNLFRRGDYVVCYLHRTIEVEHETPATLLIGSDDAITVWLNGEKIHDNRAPRPVLVDQDEVPINLQAGTNQLLMKVGNLQGDFGFAYRLSQIKPALLPQLEERLNADFPTGEAVYYRIETIPVPPGILLEVGGMAFLPNGGLMVSTRRGEVWSADLKKNQWQLFASGLHEPLGVCAIGNHEIVVAQRPELTRLKDTDGDGKADVFETVCDAFGVSGNYHEYHYGPARDGKGNLYGTLNVAWEDGGVSWVPYRGWAYKVTRRGEFIPYAVGFRSPAGVGLSPDGELFVTDNQGDWWGTSPLLHVTQGSFYGHPAGLKWETNYCGPNDPRTIPLEQLTLRRKLPAAWFVYGPLGRSPTEPVWDTTRGKFGPFKGQMFVGDQTQCSLARIALEKVGGEFQGAIFPFRNGFASGITRETFGTQGGLYVGMTDRGWSAVGGRLYALQRLVWTGKTPLEIQTMKLTKDGFDLTFTKPIEQASGADPATYSVQHYHYHYHRTYGSPQVDVTPVKVRAVKISSDRKTVSLALPELLAQKVYELHVGRMRASDGSELLHPDAYYTLNRLVEK